MRRESLTQYQLCMIKTQQKKGFSLHNSSHSINMYQRLALLPLNKGVDTSFQSMWLNSRWKVVVSQGSKCCQRFSFISRRMREMLLYSAVKRKVKSDCHSFHHVVQVTSVKPTYRLFYLCCQAK